MSVTEIIHVRRYPQPAAALRLIKPITWFPPMWALSLAVGWQLGPWGFGATVVGVLAAWAYSAEPVRLKRSGWWGPGLVGLSYESLPWFTGAAVLAAGAPSWPVVIVA